MRIDPIGHLLPPKPPRPWMYVVAAVLVIVAIVVTVF